MKDTIITFSLDGHKQNYIRRIDMYGVPVITTRKQEAKMFNKTETPNIIKALLNNYKERIKDIKLLNKNEEDKQ